MRMGSYQKAISNGFISLFIFIAFSACQKSPEKQPGSGQAKNHLVETQLVTMNTLHAVRTRTGTLRARREVKLHSQEEGEIIRLPYFSGDRVKQGELVAEIDSTLIRVQLTRATISRKQAQQDANRLKKLRSSHIVSDDEYNQALTRLELAKADEAIFKTRMKYTRIVSPINGVVTERLTEPGNFTQKYQHILSVSDPSTLYTELRVSGLLLPSLQVGDTTKIKIDALGKQFYSGVISRIHPVIDTATRRGTIEVELSSVPEGAIAGQLCRVELVGHSANRQVIKYSALRRDGDGKYVFIMDEDNTVQRKTVTTGLRLAENIEIIDGLENGQKVVVKGFLGLTQGEKVKPVTPQAYED